MTKEKKVPFHQFLVEKIMELDAGDCTDRAHFTGWVMPILTEVEIPAVAKPLVADAILSYIPDTRAGVEKVLAEVDEGDEGGVADLLAFLAGAQEELRKQVVFADDGQISLRSAEKDGGIGHPSDRS